MKQGHIEEMRISRTRRWLPVGALTLVALVITASVYTALQQGDTRPQPEGNLVAHWAFQKRSEREIIDTAGGHNGTLYEPRWILDRRYFSVPLLRLDGEKTFVEIPPDPALTLGGSFTIAAWIKVDSRNRRQALFHKADPAGDLRHAPVTFYAPWGQGRLGLVLSDGEKRVGFLSDSPIRGGGWHHVAVTYHVRTGKIRYYIDGEPAGEDTTSWRPRPQAQSGPVLLGAAGTPPAAGWHYFQGELYSLRLYNRVLGPDEIEALALHPS